MIRVSEQNSSGRAHRRGVPGLLLTLEVNIDGLDRRVQYVRGRCMVRREPQHFLPCFVRWKADFRNGRMHIRVTSQSDQRVVRDR